jgi:pSer/pThr/pTyr-binding forkhead associated (FHA) protein
VGDLDFPTLYAIGSYGGLACCLLAASAIAAYALVRHRGTPRQLARAILVCLAAACLILVPIWWNQNRLEIYGPALGSGEVLLWLTWSALAGWFVPLGTLAGYATLAAPQAVAPFPIVQRAPASGILLAALDDPARQREPLGSGTPWGRLVPLAGDYIGQPVALTRQLTLLGRELDNDIVTDDERTSRHHAELHWDHGHVHVLDRRSMNGTLVNRQPVRGLLPLKSGDILELGAQRYRIEILPSGPLASGQFNLANVETAKMASAGTDVLHEPPPALVLFASAGPIVGARWELRDAVTTLGRDPERQLCLPHESVSRLHAQVVRQRTGFFVSDLHSRNGTLLNGQRLGEPRMLHVGDILRLGEVELRCEALDTVSAPAPASPADTADAPAAPQPTPPTPHSVLDPSHRHEQPTVSLVPQESSAPADAF